MIRLFRHIDLLYFEYFQNVLKVNWYWANNNRKSVHFYLFEKVTFCIMRFLNMSPFCIYKIHSALIVLHEEERLTWKASNILFLKDLIKFKYWQGWCPQRSEPFHVCLYSIWNNFYMDTKFDMIMHVAIQIFMGQSLDFVVMI